MLRSKQANSRMQAEERQSKLETRYQFHSMIGHGGAGEVFAAWDGHLKRTVAIKRMKTQGITDNVLDDFWQEAMRLAAIRHSNIVTVYDLGLDDHVPYIVMELVQGETVEDYVAKNLFSVAEFGELARQSLDGLIAAHHAGLIHRDLKPSNIMLSRLPSGAFQVKILDFGMAKFVATPAAQTMNIDGSITGSIHYISPEQLNRQVVDVRSDLYSLGCVFYFALSGHEPFNGENTPEVLTAHLSHNVVSLELYRPDLPPILCQWVMALINLQPEHRYQSAMQALVALNGILVSTHSVAIPVTSTTTIITPPVAPPGVDAPIETVAQQQPTAPEAAPEPVQPVAAYPAPDQSSSPWGKRLMAGTLVLLILIGAGLLWFQAEDRFFGSASSQVIAPVASPSPVTPPPPASPLPTPADAAELPEVAKAGELAVVGAQASESVAAGLGEAVETKVESPGEIPATESVPSEPELPAVAVPAATSEPSPVAAAPPPPAPVPLPPPVTVPAKVVFRVHGSNTIGAQLLPALMEEVLRMEGATDVQRKPGDSSEEMSIEATLPGEEGPIAIEIAAHGSTTAFDGLLSGVCDLGMASRQVKAEEVTAIAAANLGDLRLPAYEHVLGLDGIAILVNRNNSIRSLTKQEIAKIFTGEIADWSEVGGQPGAIHLYARDEKSGTFDTFKSLVLGKAGLRGDAKRYEDSNELSDAVSSDPYGIGFVGLPFVRNTKALAVSDVGASPLIATRFTVATEDYLLSRRLFLYTPANSDNIWARKLVDFALSDEGQAIVEKLGFIRQTPELQQVAAPPEAPDAYGAAIKDAERLSLNLRFRPSSLELDNKALRDLDRITNLLAQKRYQGRSLLLLGFTDNLGSSPVNLRLSKERAQMIAQEFAARGIPVATVTGFGAVLPVASNETEAGRDKNRRVEVWLK